uniref:Uncharacterized protein n=1 Tax=Arundo donax TaxID=35708 RepID=A0A0A8Y8P5_ARUDO
MWREKLAAALNRFRSRSWVGRKPRVSIWVLGLGPSYVWRV